MVVDDPFATVAATTRRAARELCGVCTVPVNISNVCEEVSVCVVSVFEGLDRPFYTIRRERCRKVKRTQKSTEEYGTEEYAKFGREQEKTGTF